jgi:hypothetical protein
MGVRHREYNINQTYFAVIDPEYIKQSNSLLSTIDSFIEERVFTAPFDAIAQGYTPCSVCNPP